MSPRNNNIRIIFRKKSSDAGHFGRNTCDFAIFYKRCSQGRINERGLYSAKIQGFIINKMNLRRKANIIGEIESVRTNSVSQELKNSKEKSNSSGSLTFCSKEESKESTRPT